MKSSSTKRLCPSCGASVSEGAPCVACSLAGALETLGFNEPAPPPGARFSPLDLPSTFGPYLVEREIAAGGTGMVYEAEDTRLGRHVALKMLRQVFFATEQERLRFQSEAELASQLDHPHIVPVHEVGEQDGQPYFTMKLIRGGSLADRLSEKPLPVREAVEKMISIAGAVHFAHQHGVLHRDLKPANVLLDEAGEPWLTDFGLAKLLDSDSGLTLTQAIAGTPHYMSPEQAAGRKSDFSTATDVWALGVVFYQMLTGHLPFQGESSLEIMRKVEEREPPKPSTIVSRIDRDLETLCLRCLEKNPARRLASAGELAEELKRWQRGEPVRARPITGWERVAKWARRHPYRTAAVAAFLLVVLGAGTVVTWLWRQATHNEQLALAKAEAERHIVYSSTLSSALSARENHNFGQARRLLASIDPELRGFDWHLLNGLCRGDEVQSFRLGEGRGAEPQCLAMVPGLDQIALISADGHLHLRNLYGEEVAPPRALPPISRVGHRYDGLTFSPNGQRFAYTHGDLLHVVEAQSLTLLYEATTLRPQCGWLDDHRLLYGFNGSMTGPPVEAAWILDFENVRSPGEVPYVTLPPLSGAPLAVSPDRRFFVLARVNTAPTSWERTFHLYPSDGDFGEISEPVYSMPGSEYPGQFTVSKSGRYLAFSAGVKLKRSARVLDLSSGEVLFDREFRFPIDGLAIDPDEQRLVLVGGDSVVRVYDFTRVAPQGGDAETYDDEVAPAHRQQVGGGGARSPPRELLTRSAQDGRARFFLGHEQRVTDIVFDATGSFITASGDGTVRRWEDRIPRPAVRIGYQRTAYDLRHPSASADGRHVLYFDSTSLRCDVARSRSAQENVVVLAGRRQSPLAVLGDGRPITQDHESADVVIWNVQEGQCQEQRRIRGEVPFSHSAQVQRARLSHDERRLAGVLAGRLFTVDLEADAPEIAWSDDLGRRASVHANHDLSPDGEWIASSDFGPQITIHRFADPNQIVTRLVGESRGYDTAVAFSRDGRRLYTGNEDGRIRAWDTATWQERPELGWLAHRSAVTALAVSHGGSLLASSGGDSLKLFPLDPEPGETYRRERLSFRLDRPANWIQFARDDQGKDRALLHSVPGRTLEVWETDF